jgi:hypothetical protein
MASLPGSNSMSMNYYMHIMRIIEVQNLGVALLIQMEQVSPLGETQFT